MPFERRIGERFDVGGIPVGWQTSRPAKLTRAQRKQLDPRIGATASLRSASMSGAAILAGSDPALGPGTSVEVHLDAERWFLSRIRRVLVSSEPGWSYYGVLYVQVSEAYQVWLNTLVDHRRAELTESTWRRAD
jgi:hypothetical protein